MDNIEEYVLNLVKRAEKIIDYKLSKLNKDELNSLRQEINNLPINIKLDHNDTMEYIELLKLKESACDLIENPYKSFTNSELDLIKNL